jgi:hypothetical protein
MICQEGTERSKNPDPVPARYFIEPPAEPCSADIVSVSSELRPRAVESMAGPPETDHTLSIDTGQKAPDPLAHLDCPLAHRGGMRTRSADMGPDLSTMPKEPVLFLLAACLMVSHGRKSIGSN